MVDSPEIPRRQGLLALWREGLLAQRVLRGETKGYANHPQLDRFKRTSDPPLYIGTYLYHVYLEGAGRGYSFNPDKILSYDLTLERIPVTRGQLKHEHLRRKLAQRSPANYLRIAGLAEIEPRPLFRPVPGGVEPWEKKTAATEIYLKPDRTGPPFTSNSAAVLENLGPRLAAFVLTNHEKGSLSILIFRGSPRSTSACLSVVKSPRFLKFSLSFIT